MTEDNQELRAALHRLGNAAAPADLTERAHDRSGQIRRRRVAAGTAAVAAAAAVVVIGGTQLLAAEDADPPIRPPSVTPAPTPAPTDPSPSGPPSAPPSVPPTGAAAEPTELVGVVTFDSSDGDGTSRFVGTVGAAPDLVATTARNGTIAPDGSLVAYSELETDAAYAELWVSRLDGSDARSLGWLPAIEGRDVLWSPDSTRLAVTDLFDADPRTAERVRGRGSAIVPVDGSEPIVLSPGYTGGISPAWSPDGHLVAFREGPAVTGDGAIRQLVVASAEAPDDAESFPLDKVQTSIDLIQSVSDDGTRLLINPDSGEDLLGSIADLGNGTFVEPDLGSGLRFIGFVGPTTATAVRFDPSSDTTSIVLVRVPLEPTEANVAILDEAPVELPDGWAGGSITFMPDDPVEALPTEAPPITGEVVELGRFDSPTGNLRCQIVADVQAYCSAVEYDYEPPPVPAECVGDWGDAMWIRDDGAVSFACHTDTVDPTEDRLAYGTTSVVGDFACQSRDVGITCWDQRTGHGFSLARGAYALF